MTEQRHILAIEISNPGAGARGDVGGVRSGPGVALGRIAGQSVETLGVEWLGATPADQRGGIDDDLMPAMERLFARLGVRARETLRDGLVAVSIGPGGYTSLRIACAAGKMIAEAAGARCAGVPTAAAVARAARREIGGGLIAVALASKGESAWVRVLDERGAGAPGRVMTSAELNDLHAAGVRVLVGDQHLPEAMRAEAERLKMRVAETVHDPVAVMEVGMESPALDPVELIPLYPREPDAVTLWRARKQP